MAKPLKTEYPDGIYFSRYIESVDNENVIETLKANLDFTENLYKSLNLDQLGFRYDTGKWNLKEILGHITDTERIFGYRALAIARGEQKSLPGFDENEYMDMANFDSQSIETLMEQYRLVRLASIALFESFSDDVLSRMGKANDFRVSARGMIYMIAGHEIHHLKIIKERYLA